MSLIQEALRRRDEESGGGPDKIPPRVVLPIGDASPPVMKLPEHAVPEKKPSHLWASLALLLVIGVIAAIAALAWFFYKFTPFLQSAQAPLTSPAVSMPTERKRSELVVELRGEAQRPGLEPESAQKAKAVQSVPAAPSRLMGPVEQTEPLPAAEAAPRKTEATLAAAPESVTKPAEKSPDAGSAAISGPPPVNPAETSVETRVGGRAPVAASEVKAVPVAVAARTSVWPRLTLNGVMAQTGPGQGSAIINGTVVEIGEKIEGVRLLEVQRNGVLLEFKGQTQFVRVGQSTY